MLSQLCLAHLTLFELTRPQLVNVAPDTGFGMVSMLLPPYYAGEKQLPMMGGTPMTRETPARLFDRGVVVNDVELISALEFMPWCGIKTVQYPMRGRDCRLLRDHGRNPFRPLLLLRRRYCRRTVGQLGLLSNCDAPAQRPTSDAGLLYQAQKARLPLGSGGLYLVGMLHTSPLNSVISVEVPLHGLPNLLPPVDRARTFYEATLKLIEKVHVKS